MIIYIAHQAPPSFLSGQRMTSNVDVDGGRGKGRRTCPQGPDIITKPTTGATTNGGFLFVLREANATPPAPYFVTALGPNRPLQAPGVGVSTRPNQILPSLDLHKSLPSGASCSGCPSCCSLLSQVRASLLMVTNRPVPALTLS